jgi:DNA/RNA-binding protein KIN17
MPKAEKGTPKYLANKMKSKGLQKLRWYCQMCQKQCRDENGFKCHTTSEAHQRQLLLFGESSRRFLDEFSKEFSDGFMELLRRRFGTRRVPANQVYQEYISDKNHLHMNATKWLSLTGYVQYLGREGKCIVDETEKGWYITYIDRDPETIARQQALAKKQKMDKDDEERMLEFVEKQVDRTQNSETAEPVYTELKRDNEEEKIVLKLKPDPEVETKGFALKSNNLAGSSSVFKVPKSVHDKWETSSSSSSRSTSSVKKKSALEQIREEEERKKAKKYMTSTANNWLHKGIVVKIITSQLGDKYYKQKGVVADVLDDFVAIVKLLESGHKLKLDQAHLETVIPSVGNVVKILNGEFRTQLATVERIDTNMLCVDIEIRSGKQQNRVLRGIPFRDVSKMSDMFSQS